MNFATCQRNLQQAIWNFVNFECVESGNVLTLAKSELKHLLDSTLYPVAKELTLPIYTAVNFKAENDSLILSATNRARLAIATTQNFNLQGEFNCNIDSEVLRFAVAQKQRRRADNFQAAVWR